MFTNRIKWSEEILYRFARRIEYSPEEYESPKAESKPRSSPEDERMDVRKTSSPPLKNTSSKGPQLWPGALGAPSDAIGIGQYLECEVVSHSNP